MVSGTMKRITVRIGLQETKGVIQKDATDVVKMGILALEGVGDV